MVAAIDCESASYSKNLWRRFPIMEPWRGTKYKMYGSNEAPKVPNPNREGRVTFSGNFESFFSLYLSGDE